MAQSKQLRHQHDRALNLSGDKNMFKKLYGALLVLLCTACTGNSQALWASSNNFGVVVNDGLIVDKGVTPKSGFEMYSETGRYLSGHAELNKRNGGTSGYGGIGLPKWVNVSWREPIYGERIATVTGQPYKTLDFGKKLGDFRIEVASRIPKEVLQYASAKKGRAIKLMFRILDDNVVLGWCVQEAPPPPAGGWVFSNYGGDFMPARWYNGKLIEMGWYIDKKTGQRIETTTGG
jgi:hypothetical protein